MAARVSSLMVSGTWFMRVAPPTVLSYGSGALWRRPAGPGRLRTGRPGPAGCLRRYFVATTYTLPQRRFGLAMAGSNVQGSTAVKPASVKSWTSFSWS